MVAFVGSMVAVVGSMVTVAVVGSSFGGFDGGPKMVVRETMVVEGDDSGGYGS
ncbi:hypothetical protein M8C21_005647 [Ambrosia artemisiifolia]|uniref:Uncharacterized protein n=1 Tax=Ambrosia artemisiifolia TaxID=4212 RepID=A0AAD5BR11_AMBAR|nr:hypothetical protein M8C21_005647 [Ambrosia artemisiifolia]